MNLRHQIDGLRQLWHFDNRWHLVVGRLVFRRDTVMVYRIGGMQIVVDHAAGDANGIREVFTTPMYRRTLEALDRATVHRVLDIGAHTGSFVLLMVSMGFAVEHVGCVEMNPQTARRLSCNVLANLRAGAADVRVIEAAVCGGSGLRMAHTGHGSTGHFLGAIGEDGHGDHALVRAMTFDEVVDAAFGPGGDQLTAADTIDVCKIDVEGAEYEIFSNPGHESIARCRTLIIEIHELVDQDRWALIDRIVALGFVESEELRDGDVHVFRNVQHRT
jgi:FkbM family methyltransferase